MPDRTNVTMLVLVIVAELLAVAFFAISLVLDNATLHSKYSFTPWSVSTYTGWGTSAEVIVPALQMPLMAYAYVTMESRAMRFLPFAACAVSVALLIVGNVLERHETPRRIALESAFAVKFNDFYCDTRTLRMCLEGESADVLTLTRGNDSDVSTTENATQVGLAIWHRCNDVLLQSIALEARLEGSDGDNDDDIQREGEIEVDLPSFHTFLNDCTHSHVTDAWCGQRLQRTTPHSNTEQQALPSAFAANPSMFHQYKREWSKRMVFSNALLGAAISCVLVAGGLSLRSTSR